ncbi:hypothetical protein [Streptomyces sp. NPDC055006]
MTEDAFTVETAMQHVADARGRDDRLGEALALYDLTLVLFRSNQADQAEAVRAQLEPIGAEIGSSAMEAFAQGLSRENWRYEATALFDLSRALREASRRVEGERLYTQASQLVRRQVDKMNRENGEAAALNAERALATARKEGDPWAEAYALRALGAALREAGRPQEAADAKEEGQRIEARERLGRARHAAHAAQLFGDRSCEAVALLAAQTALADLGRMAEAHSAIAQAEQLVFDVVTTTELAVAHPAPGIAWLAGHPTLEALGKALRDVGRDETAERLVARSRRLKADEVSSALVEAMETARQAAEDAHERGDTVGEARALTMLAHSLDEDHRPSEASLMYDEALRMARQVIAPHVRDQALRAIAINVNWQLYGVRNHPDWLQSAGPIPGVRRAFRSFRAARSSTPSALQSTVPIPTPVELLAGFVALKVLGPFTQAFATKLGEALGESTARAIGRLRLLLHTETNEAELDILQEGAMHTTLVLPSDLTDQARAEMIDLDVTDPHLAGKTLRWYPDAGKWLAEPPPPNSTDH